MDLVLAYIELFHMFRYFLGVELYCKWDFMNDNFCILFLHLQLLLEQSLGFGELGQYLCLFHLQNLALDYHRGQKFKHPSYNINNWAQCLHKYENLIFHHSFPTILSYQIFMKATNLKNNWSRIIQNELYRILLDFRGFINIIIIQMLYGQRIQQNERETKMKKSQLYREMLDNQIKFNQHYRQSKPETNILKHSQIHSSFQHMPIIQRRGQEQLQSSFIHEIEKQQAHHNHFLPVLKDSNKFMKGVSRFVKVEQPVKQKNKQVHVYTEMIEEQDNDEYDQVCQKIIRDLQDIKNKPVKARNRRKVYGNTEMQPHRRNRLYTETRFQPENREKNSQPKNYESVKAPSMNSSKNKVLRHIPAETQIDKAQPNQFQTFTLKQQSRLKLNQFQLQKSSSPTEDTSNRKQQLTSNFNKSMNSKLDSYSPSTVQLQNQKAQQKDKIDTNKNEKSIAKNILVDRQRKNNNSVSYNQTEPEFKEEAKLVSQNATRLELKRQNFLQVLRKVKNRGESLYLKLARYPNEKTITHQ